MEGEGERENGMRILGREGNEDRTEEEKSREGKGDWKGKRTEGRV